MKFIQLSPDKIRVIDDDKERTLLSLFFIVLGITIVSISIFPFQEGDISVPSSVVFGLSVILAGAYTLCSKRVSICCIDRFENSARVVYKSFLQKETINFRVSEIKRIEITENSNLYYRTYRAKFVLSDSKAIPLTIYSDRRKALIKELNARIATFLNIEVQFSESEESTIPMPPAF